MEYAQAGGGRKRVEEHDDTLIDLDYLVEPTTRGDPESPLRCCGKSVSKLTAELQQRGHRVSAKTVYTVAFVDELQSAPRNRKTREGKDHPDRDAQFEHRRDNGY